eukprot:TRINITY_DN5118_c0_g1_i1.p1 TRINITY_DN5118_c0_g1~~TRINITY_DN5118_c0_g1_i1.p1  ORF type:complete len:427 (-),score=90.71 TRINITY_DN5118_c0_g1_i1:67-1347(-)
MGCQTSKRPHEQVTGPKTLSESKTEPGFEDDADQHVEPVKVASDVPRNLTLVGCEPAEQEKAPEADFAVSLTRRAGEDLPLGISVAFEEDRFVRVRDVKDNGLVPAWNQENEAKPELQLHEGDTIVSVNGVSIGADLIQRELKSDNLVLAVKRGSDGGEPIPEATLPKRIQLEPTIPEARVLETDKSECSSEQTVANDAVAGEMDRKSPRPEWPTLESNEQPTLPHDAYVAETEPESTRPERTDLEATEPEQMQSEPTKHESNAQPTISHDAYAEATEPERIQPEPTKPESNAQPTISHDAYAEATEPERIQPEPTKPEATEPERIQPEPTKPEATELETTKLEATEPEVTKSELIEATEPEVMKSEVLKETEPEVTKAEAKEPAVVPMGAKQSHEVTTLVEETQVDQEQKADGGYCFCKPCRKER